MGIKALNASARRLIGRPHLALVMVKISEKAKPAQGDAAEKHGVNKQRLPGQVGPAADQSRLQSR